MKRVAIKKREALLLPTRCYCESPFSVRYFWPTAPQNNYWREGSYRMVLMEAAGVGWDEILCEGPDDSTASGK